MAAPRWLTNIVWLLVAWLLLLHLFTTLFTSAPDSTPAADAPLLDRLNSLVRHTELQEIEEIPVFPAAPRRPKKHHHRSPADDPLTDLSPHQRRFFFPDPNAAPAVHPNMSSDNPSYRFFFPGRQWRDSDGAPIQAHGAGLLYVPEIKTFFWYGENKQGPTYHIHRKSSARVDLQGISCYSSTDLWDWTNEGVVLRPDTSNASSDLHTSKVAERPKVIYNDRSRQYVMWIHVDNGNYSKASVGVAASSDPRGPFFYLGSVKPHGFDSRDMTVFKDDDPAASAFLVYASNSNSELHVTRLTDDYLGLEKTLTKALVNAHREAPAVFKHRGIYYMLTSGCTGWSPNAALLHAAESMQGPWHTLGDPCVGASEEFRKTTFYSQVSFVLPLPGLPDMFVFIADRWNPGNLSDSRYVWLPLTVDGPLDEPLNDGGFEFPLWSRISVRWHTKWKLPNAWNNSDT